MASTPNEVWADTPFHLIPVPEQPLHGVHHSSIHCASEMASAHNVLIRGINAIVLQAPLVPVAGSPGYSKQDVTDLLFYVNSWCKMVDHHHETEEAHIFPEIEKAVGQPGLLQGAADQHALFHDGLVRLLEYSRDTAPEKYRWDGAGGMKEIIDGFSEALTAHLYAEIDIFLGLKDLDNDKLRAAWDKGEVYAKQNGNMAMLYDVFPCVLGNGDRTFKGSALFPPLPSVVPYLIHYWFARGNGAWKFNSCDFWGQPRPLYYRPTRR